MSSIMKYYLADTRYRDYADMMGSAERLFMAEYPKNVFSIVYSFDGTQSIFKVPESAESIAIASDDAVMDEYDRDTIHTYMMDNSGWEHLRLDEDDTETMMNGLPIVDPHIRLPI